MGVLVCVISSYGGVMVCLLYPLFVFGKLILVPVRSSWVLSAERVIFSVKTHGS